MSFNWLIYLNVANHLLSQKGEGYWGSAISRAYYAVFGAARKIIESQGVQFKADNIHKEVINWLRKHRNLTTKRAGVNLDRLRREHNKADYDDGKRVSRNDASIAVTLSHKIKRDLATM